MFKCFISLYVQIHLTSFDEFIEQFEGKREFLDDGLKFAIDRKFRRLVLTGAFDVRPPACQFLAPLVGGSGIFVGDIIHFAAKRIEGGHGVAFGFWQQDKSQREIGRAFTGNRAAVLHQDLGSPGDFFADRIEASLHWCGASPGRRLR